MPRPADRAAPRDFALRAALLTLLLQLALPVPAAAAPPEGLLSGHVLRVIDGDTIEVRLQSGRVRVRLQGVDAPERDQPGGREATAFLRARLADSQVLLEPVSQDQYDRLVAVVHRESVNLNEALVREGHAWAFRRYLRREDRRFCALEGEARAAARGLWHSRTGPAHAPWEHRATRGRGPFTDFSGASAADCLRSARRSAR